MIHLLSFPTGSLLHSFHKCLQAYSPTVAGCLGCIVVQHYGIWPVPIVNNNTVHCFLLMLSLLVSHDSTPLLSAFLFPFTHWTCRSIYMQCLLHGSYHSVVDMFGDGVHCVCTLLGWTWWHLRSLI